MFSKMAIFGKKQKGVPFCHPIFGPLFCSVLAFKPLFSCFDDKMLQHGRMSKKRRFFQFFFSILFFLHFCLFLKGKFQITKKIDLKILTNVCHYRHDNFENQNFRICFFFSNSIIILIKILIIEVSYNFNIFDILFYNDVKSTVVDVLNDQNV